MSKAEDTHRVSIWTHFCGQQQPHPAHVWHTPPIYGTTTVISEYQCGGLSVDQDGAR